MSVYIYLGFAAIPSFARINMRAVITTLFGIALSWWWGMREDNSSDASPRQIIMDHAVRHRDRLAKRGNITDLELDSVILFRKYTCLEGSNITELRETLVSQLSEVPNKVSRKLSKLALPGNMTLKTAGREGGTDINGNGRAYFTVYDIATRYRPGFYSTCVLVSGVELEVADSIIGWQNESYTDIIGHEPCHCGWLRCETCPIFRTRFVSTPIIKKYALSLASHNDIFNFISNAAVELVPIASPTVAPMDDTETPDADNHLVERWEGIDVKAQ